MSAKPEKLRICFYSNSPLGVSAYSKITKAVTSFLHREGYPVAVAVNWGHEGCELECEGVKLYPRIGVGMSEKWAVEAAKDFGADIMVSIYDQWALGSLGNWLQEANIPDIQCCHPSETLIHTPSGSIPINDGYEASFVLSTYNDRLVWAKVTAWHSIQTYTDLYELETETGKTLIATGDHLILTDKWKSMKRLLRGQTVFTFDHDGLDNPRKAFVKEVLSYPLVHGTTPQIPSKQRTKHNKGYGVFNETEEERKILDDERPKIRQSIIKNRGCLHSWHNRRRGINNAICMETKNQKGAQLAEYGNFTSRRNSKYGHKIDELAKKHRWVIIRKRTSSDEQKTLSSGSRNPSQTDTLPNAIRGLQEGILDIEANASPSCNQKGTSKDSAELYRKTFKSKQLEASLYQRGLRGCNQNKETELGVWERITKIRRISRKATARVYDLTTTTGNFFANSILSHNCMFDHAFISLPLRSRLSQAFEILSPTKYGENLCRQAGLTNVTVIPFGVDTKTYQPLDIPKPELRASIGFPNYDFVFGIFSMTRIRKGIPYGLEAIRMAVESNPDLKAGIYIHGLPVEEYDLIKILDALDLTKISRFPDEFHYHLGWDEVQMAKAMNSVDCIVQAAFGEGFGLPIIEGMASGIPVVGSKHTSFTELIEPVAPELLAPPLGEMWVEGIPSKVYLPNPEKMADIFDKLMNMDIEKIYRDKLRQHALQYDWETSILPKWPPYLDWLQQQIDERCVKIPEVGPILKDRAKEMIIIE